MGILSNVLGRDLTMKVPVPPVRTEDDIAIDRYEHRLRTATPASAELEFADALEALTPRQRDLMFDRFIDSADRPVTPPIEDTVRPTEPYKAEIPRSGSLARPFSIRDLPRYLLVGGGALVVISYIAVAAAVTASFDAPANEMGSSQTVQNESTVSELDGWDLSGIDYYTGFDY